MMYILMYKIYVSSSHNNLISLHIPQNCASTTSKSGKQNKSANNRFLSKEYIKDLKFQVRLRSIINHLVYFLCV